MMAATVVLLWAHEFDRIFRPANIFDRETFSPEQRLGRKALRQADSKVNRSIEFVSVSRDGQRVLSEIVIATVTITIMN
jgi:hypothetical protein